MSKKPHPARAHYRAIVVAPTEPQAHELLEGCTAYPGLLFLGISSPDTARELLTSTGAELVIALAGSQMPDLGPGVTVALVSDTAPAQDLQRQLGAGSAAAPLPPPAVTAAVFPDPPPATPRAAPPAPPPDLPLARQVRVGVAGARGGLGVTTVVIAVAQALQNRGARVAICDALRRGDVALRLGGTPSAEPQTLAGLYVYPGVLSEAQGADYDAIVVDGGRQRVNFAARWYVLNNATPAAWTEKILREV